MEKYLIHSNELHFINKERIHREVPIFYSNQFQTTISPSPDVPSVVGKGNRYLPY